MPPPGIPDWLYPSVVLQDIDSRSGFVWVQSVYCTSDGDLQVEIRSAEVVFPVRGGPLRVTIAGASRAMPASLLAAQYEPPMATPVYVAVPENRNPTFTRLPLTGFRRIAVDDPGSGVPDPGFEAYMGSAPDAEIHSPLDLIPENSPAAPPEGTDEGLELLSNHTLVDSVRAGVIRIASAPRVSPLGGVTVFIMQDGPGERTFLGRADLGLPSLDLNHDEVRGVRILTNRDIQRRAARSRAVDPAQYDMPAPAPNMDGSLEVLTNAELLRNLDLGLIRFVSPPRVSSLGGVALYIQAIARYRITLDRAALNLDPLYMRHGDRISVRVLPATGAENLRPSPWVAEATEALAAMAERRLVSNQTLLESAGVPQEENEENLNFYTPRTWADAPNFEAGRANAEEEGLDTSFVLDPDIASLIEPEVTLGTVMVARNNPDTRVGIVTRVDHEWSDGQDHTFVSVRLSEDGFYNDREVRMPLEGLLAQAMPAGNAFPPEARQPTVQIFEATGGALAETSRFLAETGHRLADTFLRSTDPVQVAQVVGLKLEPPKPARTSFERLLEDDDD